MVVQITIRRKQGIHSRSVIKILKAQASLYAAAIDDNLCVKLGDGSWCPTGKDWVLATCGIRYAVWCR